MQYVLLIYTDERWYSEAAPEEVDRVLQAYWQFERDVRGAGVHVAGEALQPTATATTVRIRNGETLITDGPFAETKEQLGGFYLLECRDMDDALQWAARIPSAPYGSIEVRPVMVFEQPAAAAPQGAETGGG